MYELSVACQYLLPRWRQLSVSIISLISILVIALVVWLIVVFFSVTTGLYALWTQKLITVTAPIRITPTDAYYNSYYYQIDSLAANSNYALKSIHEKSLTEVTNPYDPHADEELPHQWPQPDLNEKGHLRDLVKEAYQAIRTIPYLKANAYEASTATIHLSLIRSSTGKYEQGNLQQAVLLGSLDPDNSTLSDIILPLRSTDVQNVLSMLAFSPTNVTEDETPTLVRYEQSAFMDQLLAFFNSIKLTFLETPSEGWRLPKALIPEKGTFHVAVYVKNNKVYNVIIPQQAHELDAMIERYKKNGLALFKGKLEITPLHRYLQWDKQSVSLDPYVPLTVPAGYTLPVELVPTSLALATQIEDLKFTATFNLQGVSLKGEIPLAHLNIHGFTLLHSSPFWVHSQAVHNNIFVSLPVHNGQGVLLPKGYIETGVRIGDHGYLSYMTPTASSLQEQREPIFVAGFYDPGLISMGGKLILTNQEVTALLRAAQNQEGPGIGNGINVRFDALDKAEEYKQALQKAFLDAGIAPYWKIETYRDYDFSKDLMQQLRSEKNLFTLLAIVIIIVACSNIISMLIILVNDKKQEIGILRSMGASSASIAFIFGTCGIVMGVTGSLIGIGMALFTLEHLQTLVDFISKMQGYELLNPVFYGKNLPNTVSPDALVFVFAMTAITSLLAGIVPAVKACLLRPSAILKAE